MSKPIYQPEGKKCRQCQKPIASHKKFCNNSCSAKHNNTKRSALSRAKQAKSASKTIKTKISNGVIKINNPKGNQMVERIDYTCPTCKNNFKTIPSRPRIYCSTKCHVGGYREGSGRAKTGYHQGHYCGSTYELAWIIYQLDHHQQFQRFPGYLTDGSLKYYPDFLLPDNTIIEIKGYHTDLVDRKTQLAKSKGYDIKVLYKDDLKEVFDYVSTKYQIPQSKFYTLYE